MQKQMMITSLVFLSSFASMASLPGLEQAYTRHLGRTRVAIEQTQALLTPHPKSCHQRVLDLSDEGRIDVMMAFGYMDVTAGQDYSDSGTNLYKNGDVVDLDGRKAMESLLLSPCSGNAYRVCGFSKKGQTFTKRIRDRFTNKMIRVNVTLQSPAVTASDQKNRGAQANAQAQSSERVRRSFLQSVYSHDVVIYMGHARSGGGPDFYPPVLTSSGRVNYAYYQSEQEGIRSLLGALKAADMPPKIIGLLACKSTGLFANRVKAASNESVLVTASDLFDYNDILPTGYAMLEAVVSQRCTEDFERVVKIQPNSRPFLRISF